MPEADGTDSVYVPPTLLEAVDIAIESARSAEETLGRFRQELLRIESEKGDDQ